MQARTSVIGSQVNRHYVLRDRAQFAAALAAGGHLWPPIATAALLHDVALVVEHRHAGPRRPALHAHAFDVAHRSANLRRLSSGKSAACMYAAYHSAQSC